MAAIAVAVTPSLGVNTLAEFRALLAANPGKYDYGSSGNGTTGHYDVAVTGPAGGFQPDLWVKNSADASYVGDGVYNADGAEQSKAQTVAQGVAAVYHLQLQNDAAGRH